MSQVISSILNRRISDGAIGYNNELLFPGLPGDMAWFKEVSIGTKGGNVNIIGRKNRDSIPPKFRHFGDGRITIVVSRSPHPEIATLPDCHVINDPIKALKFAQQQYPDRDIVVNGGGEIYAALFPYCEFIYSTDVAGDDRPADVHVSFPDSFILVSAGKIQEHKGIKYQFNTYQNQNILTAI